MRPMPAAIAEAERATSENQALTPNPGLPQPGAQPLATFAQPITQPLKRL